MVTGPAVQALETVVVSEMRFSIKPNRGLSGRKIIHDVYKSACPDKSSERVPRDGAIAPSRTRSRPPYRR
ncbi:hypothetical protein [Leptolyngbya iicbica]|uniref:Uncharacterized protein n=2 Tax=Cyanophyceae TaxID=3028117 RepID=A0A4Q7EHB8_9CYAN|nr:hypothetical protein DYY88_05915 [Leptolyngbya sp. LK]